MICRDAPEAVRNARVDALLVDQTEPAGGSVAEHLGIRFVTICNALALNREPDVPPPFTSWSYRRNVWGPPPKSRRLCFFRLGSFPYSSDPGGLPEDLEASCLSEC